MPAQLTPVYGMTVGNYNHDGNQDLVLSGNDFGTEVSMGRLKTDEISLFLDRNTSQI